ncbi:DUF262 domain-containing protein [Aestuariimicrobium kwangyangense]|uniref:DUF262 domain-containing protein n=1 Tax=Aestuariimicrobium kwangyangense TaxID=396389 RepID=UPI0003B37AA8|nr:DUF262 domain-containing protein [Aestuariimicrobium kwangyangense]
MPGGYEKAITIESAMRSIAERRYLLPSIQRKFTWDMDQVCRLFDSIMRHYPINSLMLWKVDAAEIRTGFRFYEFLTKYAERYAENNPDFDTKGHGEFFAVIDGQQRLTSLYIGLKGTYAVKRPRAWWPKAYDPAILPPRTLHLNLAKPLDPEQNDDQLTFEFQFLTVDALAKKPKDSENLWFEVGEILQFPAVETDDEILDHVMEYLDRAGHGTNSFARKTLLRLYFAIRREATLNYFVEESQDIGRVLDIFIRTNEGGTPLRFSDLLMSIMSANWEDARDRVDEVVNLVRVEFGFSIDRDLIMKAAVMITDADVHFQARNFDAGNVDRIKGSWDDIRDAVVATFRLIASFGLNDASLRSKNAVLPIAYYLFHKGRDSTTGARGRFGTINTPTAHRGDRMTIRTWLMMSLLRGVFGRSADSLLIGLRRIIRDNINDPEGFPLDQIVAEYLGRPRDLTFDDGFVDRLLTTQKDDPTCYSILALLQPDVDIQQQLHADHLHPAADFRAERLDKRSFLEGDLELRAFYENRSNWNGICNLWLLTENENTSKQDKPLQDWLEPRLGRTTLDPLIPPGASLDFADFKDFVERRRALLKRKLQALVGDEVVGVAAARPDLGDED